MDEAEILKGLLGQVRRAEKKRCYLEGKIRRIPEDKSADFPKLEKALRRQERSSLKAKKRVEKILLRLPSGNIAPEIYRLRHIELYSWRDIWEVLNITEAECRVIYQGSFNALLFDPYIQWLIQKEYEAQEYRGQKQRPRKPF